MKTRWCFNTCCKCKGKGNNWHRACQTTLLLCDSLSLSRSFFLWLQPWSLSTIMLLWHSFLIIIIIIIIIKVWTLAIAPLTWVRLVTSSALQSRKWQLIGMSQWCRSALCGHPLLALTDNVMSWRLNPSHDFHFDPLSSSDCLDLLRNS